MGGWWDWASGAQKPAFSAQGAAAAKLLGKEELEALHAQFQRASQLISSTSSSQKAKSSSLVLSSQAFIDNVCILPGLKAVLRDALIRVVSTHEDGKVSEEDALVAKAHAQSMGDEEAYHFAYSLLTAEQSPSPARRAEGPVSRQRLESVIAAAAAFGLGSTDITTARVAGTSSANTSTATPSVGSRQAGSSSQAPTSHSATDASVPSAQHTGGGDGSSDDGQASQLGVAVAAVASGALAAAGQQGSGSGNAGGTALSFDAYCKWAKACPAVHQVLVGLLDNVASISVPPHHPQQQQVPRLLPAPAGDGRDALLQPVWAWLVSAWLSPELRREWRLLFNSARDGKSFTTMYGRLASAAAEEHEPPTLILVRTKLGHVMGGFAPQPWVKSGAFFGNASAFIFGLLPKFVVYPATGINEKYQYLGVNNAQLPNGLAFGGASSDAALGQFALYIDSTLDHGMSRPMSTYANESLSSSQVFEVDVVECWSLLPPPPPDPTMATSAKKGGASVLDARLEDRAFMSLAGIAAHSDGVKRGAQSRPDDL